MNHEDGGKSPGKELAYCRAIASEMQQNALMRVEPTAVAILIRERHLVRVTAEAQYDTLHEAYTRLLTLHNDALAKLYAIERQCSSPSGYTTQLHAPAYVFVSELRRILGD